MKYIIDISEHLRDKVKKLGSVPAAEKHTINEAIINARPLTDFATEINNLADLHSLEIPLVYGDGEETTEKAILLEELDQILDCLTDEEP